MPDTSSVEPKVKMIQNWNFFLKKFLDKRWEMAKPIIMALRTLLLIFAKTEQNKTVHLLNASFAQQFYCSTMFSVSVSCLLCICLDCCFVELLSFFLPFFLLLFLSRKTNLVERVFKCLSSFFDNVSVTSFKRADHNACV